MSGQLDALKGEHSLLRHLLVVCDSANSAALPGTIENFSRALNSHLRQKEAMYEAAIRGCQQAGDLQSMSMLRVFHSNMKVLANAVLFFLQDPGTIPEQVKQRLRTISASLKSLQESEERVVFPIYMRAAGAGGGASSSSMR